MVEGGGDPYEWPRGGVVQARVPSDPDRAGPIPAGQGPAGQEQVAGRPRLVWGQLWLEGRGGGVPRMEEDADRGGQPLGRGRWMNAISPQIWKLSK